MKHIIHYLLCVLLLASCIEDNNLQPCDGNGQVELSVKLNTRGVPYPTNTEDGVTTIRLYAFNNDGTLDNMAFFNNTPTPLTDNPKILVKTGQKKLYAVVNETTDMLSALKAISTTDQLEALVATYTTIPAIPLLMAGKAETAVLGANGQTIQIKVVRVAARIDLMVQKDAVVAKSTLVIDQVTLGAGSNQVYLFGQVSNQDPASTAYTLTKTYATGYTIPGTTPTLAQTVYTLEGQSSPTDGHTWIKIDYTKDGEKKTHTTIINDKNAYQIKRNTRYTLTATFKGNSVSTTLTVLPWGLTSEEADVRMYAANDLANCYLVPPSTGSIMNILEFPVAQANNCDHANHIESNDVLGTELVWTDAPGTVPPNTGKGLANDGAIAAVSVIGKGPEAKIQVVAGSKEGNAVISVFKSDVPPHTILWSWHIWVTSYNPETSNEKNAENGVTFMTCNLGAANNLRFGLYYQWGRKDPLVRPQTASPYDAPKNVVDAAGNHVPQKDAGNVTVSLGYAESNPSQFLHTYGSSNWLNSDDKTLWDDPTKGTKTPYDPCPAGWRVPTAANYGAQYRPTYPISGYFSKSGEGVELAPAQADNTVWTATAATTDNAAAVGNMSLAYRSGLIGSSTQWKEVQLRLKAMNVRCVREEASVPVSLSVKYTDKWGIIDAQSNVPAERSRTVFEVTASGGTPPYRYQWMINGKVVVAATAQSYTHNPTSYNNQSIQLQCVVTDAVGRTAKTANEWMLMKRPAKDASLTPTMQSCERYLLNEKNEILTHGGSRVRNLRDERDNNIYRVKLMGDNNWWMVSNLRYEIPGEASNAGGGNFYYLDKSYMPEGSCIYTRQAAGVYGQLAGVVLCPQGWSIPSQDNYARLFPLIPTDHTILNRTSDAGKAMLINMFGVDESDKDQFEGTLTGWTQPSTETQYAIHMWTTTTVPGTNVLLRYHIPAYGYSAGFDFYLDGMGTYDRFTVRCIKN